jgi:hypothetical protein
MHLLLLQHKPLVIDPSRAPILPQAGNNLPSRAGNNLPPQALGGQEQAPHFTGNKCAVEGKVEYEFVTDEGETA